MGLRVWGLRCKVRYKIDMVDTRTWLVQHRGAGTIVFGDVMERARWGWVAHVIDGDTVVCYVGRDRVVVRLAGMDAPELWTRVGAVNPIGSMASRVMSMMILGEDVWVVPQVDGADVDVYGRTIAWLGRIPDGLCPNLELVRMGLARVYMCERRHRDLMEVVEGRARFLGRGMWAARRGSGIKNGGNPTREMHEGNGAAADGPPGL